MAWITALRFNGRRSAQLACRAAFCKEGGVGRAGERSHHAARMSDALWSRLGEVQLTRAQNMSDQIAPRERFLQRRQEGSDRGTLHPRRRARAQSEYRHGG